MLIQHLTMDEFSAGLTQTRSVVIPLGSTEQHGSHLPLDTDTIQAISVARAAANLRPLFVAPPIHYGVCRSTSEHPGTIGISTAGLRLLVMDLVSSLYRNGLRYFILLSGHAGGTHMATLMDVGEEILQRLPEAQVAVVSEYQLAVKAGEGLIETVGDSHAGEIETSRLLHSHPDLVKGTAPCEYPTFPAGILVRDKQRYWPGGIWGDPGKASADKGRKLEQAVVQSLCDLIDELERMDH